MAAKRKKKGEFPMKFSRGGTTVRVTKLKSGYFRMAFYLGGKRRTEDYKDKVEAIARAKTKLENLQRGNIDAAQISDKDRQIYARALDAIRNLDVKLDAAAHQYAEAVGVLGDVSLLEAARFYRRHHDQIVERKTVREVIDELVKDSIRLGRGERRIRELRSFGNRFATAFQIQIGDLTSDMVRKYLDLNTKAPRTFNNRVEIIQRMVTFAKGRKYLAKDTELFVERKKTTHKDPEIWTPTEISNILEKADPAVVPVIALGAFAGLRTAEIREADWAHFRRGFIEVKAAASKTGKRRLVPVSENLAAWLAPHQKQSGPVWAKRKGSVSRKRLTESTMDKDINFAMRTAAKRVGLKWRHNALRHSFISYRLAELQDVNQVALEAGNSPTIIFSNYRELVTPDEANGWFKVRPSKKSNVVAMAA
jgi:integrase